MYTPSIVVVKAQSSARCGDHGINPWIKMLYPVLTLVHLQMFLATPSNSELHSIRVELRTLSDLLLVLSDTHGFLCNKGLLSVFLSIHLTILPGTCDYPFPFVFYDPITMLPHIRWVGPASGRARYLKYCK
jgi:hypothetical protein